EDRQQRQAGHLLEAPQGDRRAEETAQQPRPRRRLQGVGQAEVEADSQGLAVQGVGGEVGETGGQDEAAPAARLGQGEGGQEEAGWGPQRGEGAGAVGEGEGVAQLSAGEVQGPEGPGPRRRRGGGAVKDGSEHERSDVPRRSKRLVSREGTHGHGFSPFSASPYADSTSRTWRSVTGPKSRQHNSWSAPVSSSRRNEWMPSRRN